MNNLNDGMAWGLFPLLVAASGLGLQQIGWLSAIYPAVWGISQIWTGHLSDSWGRKWLIASGIWVQAVGIGVTAVSSRSLGFSAGAVLLGIGTAMVYPRLWRDAGYAIGAVLAGITADLFGMQNAIWIVAGITFASGWVVAIRMQAEADPQIIGRRGSFS